MPPTNLARTGQGGVLGRQEGAYVCSNVVTITGGRPRSQLKRKWLGDASERGRGAIEATLCMQVARDPNAKARESLVCLRNLFRSLSVAPGSHRASQASTLNGRGPHSHVRFLKEQQRQNGPLQATSHTKPQPRNLSTRPWLNADHQGSSHLHLLTIIAACLYHNCYCSLAHINDTRHRQSLQPLLIDSCALALDCNMNMNKNWGDRADKDLFFTILSVKNIGVISGSEWAAIGNVMRTMGYGFTNEGCRYVYNF